jgi:hypothetical protein
MGITIEAFVPLIEAASAAPILEWRNSTREVLSGTENSARPRLLVEKERLRVFEEEESLQERMVPFCVLPTQKLEAPETGWPSCETTAQRRAYEPDASLAAGVRVYVEPSAFLENLTLSETPEELRSCILEDDEIETGSLKDTETVAGGVDRTEF